MRQGCGALGRLSIGRSEQPASRWPVCGLPALGAPRGGFVRGAQPAASTHECATPIPSPGEIYNSRHLPAGFGGRHAYRSDGECILPSYRALGLRFGKRWEVCSGRFWVRSIWGERPESQSEGLSECLSETGTPGSALGEMHNPRSRHS